MIRKLIVLLLTVYCFFALPSMAQSSKVSSVTVEGKVLHRLKLSASNLLKMRRTDVSSKDKQGVLHSYSGVALADIFDSAGVTTGPQLRGINLSKYLLVKCADGYQIVFSLAELDSAFTDRVVILADLMDGKPLSPAVGPFRIVVPGEKKPARSSFQVVSLVICDGRQYEKPLVKKPKH